MHWFLYDNGFRHERVRTDNEKFQQKMKWIDMNALTLYCKMSQNGQTHFKNLVAFSARFLKYV